MDGPVDIERARVIWGTMMDEDTLKKWVDTQNSFALRDPREDPSIPKGATIDVISEDDSAHAVPHCGFAASRLDGATEPV
jgi:hypothetical protein